MRLGVIAFLAIALVGCGSQPVPPTATDPPPSDEPPAVASLPEGPWQLTSGDFEGAPISPVAGEPIMLTISGTVGRVGTAATTTS